MGFTAFHEVLAVLLRTFVVSSVIVFGGSLPGLAQQQQTGPATLENLLRDEVAAPTQRPAATDATDPAESAVPAGRIQGAVARPKDGVQHPDLDAAWAEYDKQIDTAAQAIEQAIEKELNAAAAAGDLDAALKWKTAGERFRMDGRIPEGLDGGKAEGRPKPKPHKPETSPQSRIAEAQKHLAAAYEAVEKSLVKSRDLEKAQQVRAERVGTVLTDRPGADRNSNDVEIVIAAKDFLDSRPANKATREAARWDGLTIPADDTLTWQVNLPAAGQYFVHVQYASGEKRPCDLAINGSIIVRGALGNPTGGFMGRNLRWVTLGPIVFKDKNVLAIDPQTHGPHYGRIVVSREKDASLPDWP